MAFYCKFYDIIALFTVKTGYTFFCVLWHDFLLLIEYAVLEVTAIVMN